MGHVEKQPSGRWRARYRGPDGRARSRTFDRKVDADRFLTGVEHSKLTGSFVDPAAGKVTFQAFAENWRAVQLHRHGTAKSVELHLRLHGYPHIGHRPMASIRPSELEALVHHLIAGLSASTVHVVSDASSPSSGPRCGIVCCQAVHVAEFDCRLGDRARSLKY